jgi:hypothetical protein
MIKWQLQANKHSSIVQARIRVDVLVQYLYPVVGDALTLIEWQLQADKQAARLSWRVCRLVLFSMLSIRWWGMPSR